MFKLLMPKQSGFYDLFNEHAVTALEEIRLLGQAVRDLKNKESLVKRISDLEHACDDITHRAMDLLHSTFITPLDRNEIHLLITRLDDVADLVDAAANRLIMFDINEVPAEIVQLCDVLLKSQEKVVCVVKLLRNIKQASELKELCKVINSLENEADLLHRKGLAALFRDFKNDPLMVIKLKALYEILEGAVDNCEDVANTVEGILLEHS